MGPHSDLPPATNDALQQYSLSSEYGSDIRSVPPLITQSGVGLQSRIIEGLKGYMRSDVLLLAGACRSGTTATAIALCQPKIENGKLVEYNPGKDQVLKGFLRRVYSEFEFAIDNLSPGACLVLKETFGPHYLEETQWNPAEALIQSGLVTRSKLKVLLNLRDPIDTWSSWKKCFGEHTTLPIFMEAIKSVVNVHEYCQKNDINVQTLAVDDFDSRQAEQLRALLKNLGLAFHESMIEWNYNDTDNPFFDRKAALEYYSPNPWVQKVYGELIESPLVQRSTFAYRKPDASLNVSEEEKASILEDQGVQAFLRIIDTERQLRNSNGAH